MQFKLFVVAVTDAGEALNELNGFLRSHRVLEESHELIAGKNGSAWHFCVKYLEVIKSTGYRQTKRTIPKIDYKEVLNDKTFAIFSKLREYRKEIAREDAIPAFAVFTDKELAEIAKLPDINESGMKTINGIGEYLDLHLNKPVINKTGQGLSFLGYTLFKDHRKLNRRSKKRFIRKADIYRNNLINDIWTQEEYHEHIVPIIEFVRKADTTSLRKIVFNKDIDYGLEPC